MREHKRDRNHRGIRDEEEREDGVSQDILETWSPTFGKHFFKDRHEAARDDRSQFRSRIFKHVECDRMILVSWIKEDNIIGSRFWNIGENGFDKIAMWVDHGDPTSIQYIGVDHILEEGRFSHTSFSDNVDMSSTIDGLESKSFYPSTIVRHPDGSIWRFCRWQIVWWFKLSRRHPSDARSFNVECRHMDKPSEFCRRKNHCIFSKFT